MEDFLYCIDLFEFIKFDSTKPARKSNDDWEKMHMKAVGIIRQWVDTSVFHHISIEVDAYNQLKKLEKFYERKTTQNKNF